MIVRRYRSDISEIKRGERLIQENEQRFRDIAGLAADRFFETDENHCFTYASDPSGNLNAPLESLLGKTFWDPSTGALDEQSTKIAKEHFDGEKRFGKLMLGITRPDNIKLRVQLSASPKFDQDGRFKGFRGTISDLSELVAAQESATSIQTQFFETMENLSEGIGLYDSDHKMVF